MMMMMMMMFPFVRRAQMNMLLRLQETTMCSSVYSGDGLQLDLTSFVSDEVGSS